MEGAGETGRPCARASGMVRARWADARVGCARRVRASGARVGCARRIGCARRVRAPGARAADAQKVPMYCRRSASRWALRARETASSRPSVHRAVRQTREGLPQASQWVLPARAVQSASSRSSFHRTLRQTREGLPQASQWVLPARAVQSASSRSSFLRTVRQTWEGLPQALRFAPIAPCLCGIGRLPNVRRAVSRSGIHVRTGHNPTVCLGTRHCRQDFQCHRRRRRELCAKLGVPSQRFAVRLVTHCPMRVATPPCNRSHAPSVRQRTQSVHQRNSCSSISLGTVCARVCVGLNRG